MHPRTMVRRLSLYLRQLTPLVILTDSMNTTALATYFGPNNVPPLRSVFDLIEVSHTGISKRAVANMAKHLSIPLPDLFVIIHISLRTWQRYSDDRLLPQEVTDNALQLATLYTQGEGVFGNPEKFKGWMNHPSVIFGGKKPIELLESRFGFQAVLDELVRIDYGVLA